MKITWQNTLYTHEMYHSINEFAEVAENLGYAHFCWNGRVYEISKHETSGTVVWVDTGVTIKDGGFIPKKTTNVAYVLVRIETDKPIGEVNAKIETIENGISAFTRLDILETVSGAGSADSFTFSIKKELDT